MFQTYKTSGLHFFYLFGENIPLKILFGKISFWELPKFQALVLRNEQLVALLYTKCLIPFIDVRKRTVNTPLAERMRIILYAVADFLISNVLSPNTCIGEEETLARSKTILVLQWLLGCSILEGIV